MITASQLLAHLVGDYCLQSDWMALQKTKSWKAALAHAATYTLPFLLITRAPLALAVILGTHALIDHYRLARYVCWAKNFLAPRWIRRCKTCGAYRDIPEKSACSCSFAEDELLRNYPWAECQGTGYGPDKPPYLSVWLLFITDNTLHLICNMLAIGYLA